ncbi:RcpC/CpaB family pilus assembly protein [Streptomyces sp. MUM 203J]|uniref:RcpC/CpaB family pilus assembly protein n=1 Tax=Streptomyces sp. MUM 203J TaxID=2791990 RepID=UPI001F03D2A6|nr:RcpC/CpaB family pilus assembly protein [Streptomyces sp. MUM 203J]
MPQFAPLRVRAGRHRLRRALRRRRRALAAVMAMAAAALAASGYRQPVPPERTGTVAAPRTATATARPAGRAPEPAGAALVSAPVRIADAETVRLLKPGDRVDVIAAPPPAGPSPDGGPSARVVATGARVARVPRAEPGGGSVGGGALVVLTVPRATAAELAAASTTSRLAVTLC